jgi:hypothetical protein
MAEELKPNEEHGMKIGAIILAAIVAVLAAGTLVVRRMGYKVGGETIVRCRTGHLFTTIWVPGASLKAVRLGMTRWQRCPVGEHWTFVTPVRDDELTDEDRDLAKQYHDMRIP